MVDPLSGVLAKLLNEAIGKLVDAALARWHKNCQQQVQHGQCIVADLDAMRRGELRNTADNEWLAAQHAVGDTFNAVAPLDPQRVFSHEFTVEALLTHLRPAASTILQSAALEQTAAVGYQRMLERCCEEIVQALLDDDDVAESVSGFELFQVNVGRAPQKYPFDRFYVIPSVTRRTSSAEDDADSGLTGAGTDGANEVKDAKHVLLLGGAGAGKTTFLRWLARRCRVGSMTWSGPFLRPDTWSAAARLRSTRPGCPVPVRVPGVPSSVWSSCRSARTGCATSSDVGTPQRAKTNPTRCSGSGSPSASTA